MLAGLIAPRLRLGFASATSRNNPHCAPRHVIYYCLYSILFRISLLIHPCTLFHIFVPFVLYSTLNSYKLSRINLFFLHGLHINIFLCLYIYIYDVFLKFQIQEVHLQNIKEQSITMRIHQNVILKFHYSNLDTSVQNSSSSRSSSPAQECSVAAFIKKRSGYERYKVWSCFTSKS